MIAKHVLDDRQGRGGVAQRAARPAGAAGADAVDEVIELRGEFDAAHKKRHAREDIGYEQRIPARAQAVRRVRGTQVHLESMLVGEQLAALAEYLEFVGWLAVTRVAPVDVQRADQATLVHESRGDQVLDAAGKHPR